MPLNIWLKTDPWDDKETMLNARSFAPTSARAASRTPNAGRLILAGPFVRTGQDWGRDCGQDWGRDSARTGAKASVVRTGCAFPLTLTLFPNLCGSVAA
jgi:hypothetical protein